MKNAIGANEALILAALESGDELAVSDVAAQLSKVEVGRAIDDASIFVALQRMTERGFLACSKHRVTSRDGRSRSINYYVIQAEGRRAVAQFQREAAAVNGLLGRLLPTLREACRGMAVAK